jgi:flagellar motor switch protein FliN/FliY
MADEELKEEQVTQSAPSSSTDEPSTDSADTDAAPEQPDGAGVATAAAPDGAPELTDLAEVAGDILGGGPQSIDLLNDVELNVKIELGRTRMLVDDVLKLAEGAVVELDKLAGDPVDVYVNDRLIARGEVLVLNENFCVRVNEIVATDASE